MKRTKVILLALCGGLLLLAERYTMPPAAQGAADKVSGKLEILYTRDIKGNAELCGCSPDQKGGLPRIAGVFKERSRPNTVTLKVDCGNYLPAADDPVSPIHTPQMVGGFKALGYDVLNIGAVEAGYSLAELRKLAGSGLPLVSASLYDNAGKLLFPPLRVTSKGGLRIAWIGLTVRARPGEGLRLLSPEEAFKRVQPLLAKEKADLVCVLGDFSVDESIAVAGVAKNVHAILSARDLKFAPTTAAFVAPSTGEYGSNVGQMSVKRNGDGFEFEADLLPVDKSVSDDMGILSTVKEAGEKARKELTIAPHRTDAIGDYAGSAQCKTCHSREHEIWTASKHGHAFDILVERKATQRIDCVSCHVTGYQPRNAAYFVEHVGCESCHGPGKKHMDFMAGGKGESVSMKAGQDSCLKCHTELNSPLFTFNYYWSKIQH